MPLFKRLNYGKLIYESLRAYFAVNTGGNLSFLYKYCVCIIFPLQAAFDDYAAKRAINEIIAQCKWQIGQLTNVLNYLYDQTLNRIFISQAVTSTLSASKFPYAIQLQVRGFGDPAQAQGRKFFDSLNTSKVIINVPLGTDIASITAVIEQIKISGIPYVIQTF